MTLREARRSKKMTQLGLSEVSGVHYTQIALVETGKINIANMSARNYLKLCKALEIDPYDLLPLSEWGEPVAN